MKTAILAVAKGYDVEDVRPWAESLKNSGFSGKVFVILYDATEEIAEYFKSLDFYVLMGKERGGVHIATQRFYDYADILKNKFCEDVDLVIHTDIRDVIFQKNPEEWLIENIKDHQIIASGEGVCYRHEDWNGDGLQKQFGKKVFMEMIDTETLCSGVIAGRRDAMIHLFSTVYELAFYAADTGGFVDQHFYNLAIRKIYDKVTYVAGGDSEWTANLGTLIAIPMNSPEWSIGPRTPYNSYERIRKGGYISNMLVGLPKMIEGVICNANGQAFTIVHQYDRYQPWKETLLEKHANLKYVS
jgi:hypothetical protein